MPAVSYTRFVHEVLEIYQSRRPATREKMRQVLAEFGRLAEVRRTNDLKPVAIARWLAAHPGRAPATVDSLLRSFVAALGIALESDYLRRSPITKRSKWVKVPRPGRTELHRTPEEITRFFDRLDFEAAAGGFLERRTRVLGYLIAYTGLRKMEALGLRWSDVELERGIIHIRAHPARPLKTDAAAAAVGIHPELEPILAAWRDELAGRGPWVFPNRTGAGRGYWVGGPPGSKPLDRIKAVGRRAGLEGLTIHSFRKTIGTLARRWEISRDELQRWLRHSKIETQRYYAEADPETDYRELGATARKIRLRVATGT
jgi:integrase